MSVSIIIPWADRPEIEDALRGTLPHLDPDIEVLVVNFGGRSAILCSLLGDFEFGCLKLIHVKAPGFNKSAALNIGIWHATRPIILMMDADIVLVDRTVVEAAVALDTGRAFVIDQVSESSASPERVFAKGGLLRVGQVIEVQTSLGTAAVKIGEVTYSNSSRLGTGLLCCRKEDLLGIGGYRSELVGWGWEDVDVLLRLSLMRGLAIEQIGRCQHISHMDDSRQLFGKSRHQSEADNRVKCFEAYDQGRMTGSLDTDVCASAMAVTIQWLQTSPTQ